jgi:hypothetical protein
MSFSFNVKGSTKEEAKQAAIAEFDKVLEREKAHEHDAESINLTIDLYLTLISDPKEDENVHLMVNGSVSTMNNRVVSAGIGVNASLGRKPEEKQVEDSGDKPAVQTTGTGA